MNRTDFDTIMEEITSGLTGDAKKDIPYLKSKVRAYRDSEYAVEIARACGRIFVAIAPEEEKAKLDRMTDNHMLRLKAVIEEAQFNVYQKRFDVARDILTAAVKKIEKIKIMYQDDAVTEYHNFNSPFEEIIYAHIYKPEKDLRQAPEPLSALYASLGSVLFELDEMDAAKDALEKARRWNPIDPEISFEYAEIFKKKGNMDEFFKFNMQIFPCAYQSNYLARCYRNLGYYFVEKELWSEAAGCYLISSRYEESKHAQSELWYIHQKAGERFKMPSDEEAEALLKEYNIPVGADKNLVGLAVEFGKKFEEKGIFDMAKYLFSIAYDLTGIEEYRKKIESLPDKKPPNFDKVAKSPI